MKRIGIAAAVIVAALLAYGTAIEPRLLLDVEIERAPLDHLGSDWRGQRIAVLSDFQDGIWWDNTGMMSRAVARAVDARPAAVLLLGDFVYHPGAEPAAELEEVVDALRPLAESGIPAFAVLGNHDWGLPHPVWTGEMPNRHAGRAVREALESLGIVVLHNEAAPLRLSNDAEPLFFAGIGSRYLGEDEPGAALRHVPEDAARIVMMHHPDTFADVPARTAPLAVAGHTHGGQIRIPGLPEWSWAGATVHDEVHADGWIDGYGKQGNRLYVNRGIGMSRAPVRVNCRPELTVFVLEPSE